MRNTNLYTGCTIGQHVSNCFDKLTSEEIKLIDANSVNIKYKKHEIICKQGGLVTQLMFMKKGLAKVYLDDGVNTLVLKIIPTGNLLGLASISEENNVFQYSAMAYIDSEIKQIDIQIIRQIIRQNSEFAKDIIDILSSNSVQIYNRFFCFTHKQCFGKLADIILCLSDRIFSTTQFELPLSRREMGELSGMSTETLIRLLKKFVEDGLISIEGKTITVLDYERLKNISEKG